MASKTMKVKHFVPYFILVLFLTLSLASCLNNDHLPYFEQETGHDFRAYPSYFGHVIRGIDFGNKLAKNARKFGRSLKATSVKTVSVLDFGAKGDGTTDDTKVIYSFHHERDGE